MSAPHAQVAARIAVPLRAERDLPLDEEYEVIPTTRAVRYEYYVARYEVVGK